MYIYTYVHTICTMYEKSALSVLLSNKFKWVGCCLLLYTTVLIQVYEKKLFFLVFFLYHLYYIEGGSCPLLVVIFDFCLRSFLFFLWLIFYVVFFYFILFFCLNCKLQFVVVKFCSVFELFVCLRIWMNEWVRQSLT